MDAGVAELDEVDMDGVGEAWGDELELGGDGEGEDAMEEGFGEESGEEGEEGDEEGGWDMEVNPQFPPPPSGSDIVPHSE